MARDDSKCTARERRRPRRYAENPASSRQQRNVRAVPARGTQERIEWERGVSGKVYLVGARTVEPELLTLKALKVLGRASVVLHDALVSAEVLALIGPDAERIDVGKRCGRKLLTQDEINALLISYAKSHEVVVRLKGGDTSFFGRAGEEIAALREAGVEFEIIPGVTAAAGAAAAMGISLTDRRIASQVLFTSIHRGATNRSIQWGGISSETTVVIYMPGPDYAYVAQQLRD